MDVLMLNVKKDNYRNLQVKLSYKEVTITAC